jgi:uncharacterized RDD family membrane protein YckC
MAMLHNPALTQVLLNVALFIPSAPGLRVRPDELRLPLRTDRRRLRSVERAGFWVPWLVLTAGIPLTGSGASLGQHIVKLRAATADGRRPDAKARLLRGLTGVGGFLLNALTGALAVLADPSDETRVSIPFHLGRTRRLGGVESSYLAGAKRVVCAPGCLKIAWSLRTEKSCRGKHMG